MICLLFFWQNIIDAYFKRIADIIKKGKIPARIRFLLQDVQEMRDNNWVPRARQEKQLKTIDQVCGVEWNGDSVDWTVALVIVKPQLLYYF